MTRFCTLLPACRFLILCMPRKKKKTSPHVAAPSWSHPIWAGWLLADVPHSLFTLCSSSWDPSASGACSTLLNSTSCFQDYPPGKPTGLQSLCFWWCFQLLLSQFSLSLEVFIETNQACNTSKDMLPHVRYVTLHIPSLSTASVSLPYCKSVEWSDKKSRGYGAL